MKFKDLFNALFSNREKLTKPLLIMKLSAVLIVIGCLQVSARTYSQNVTLSSENVPLQVVFREIEKQTGFHFFYRVSLAAQFRNVNVHLDNTPLTEAMDKVLRGQPLKYKVINKTIVITQKTGGRKLYELVAPDEDALAINVSGVVTDPQGIPLAGASIKIKNTNRGVSTDDRGSYSLSNVAENAVLLISYVGFRDQEVMVQGRSVINIIMKPEQSGLNEVVVVGYGTQKKVNLTGAVDQIDGKILEDKPTSNVLRNLEGAIAGVYINMPTGNPTETYSMVVRGEGSVGAGGRALVLIDGVEGDPSRLNPADIQSVSVIKDASAAAVYGARGAFGVVLITTKNPKKNKAQLTYSTSYSLNERTVKPKMITNGYLWAKNFNDAYYERYKSYPTSINTALPFSQEYLDRLRELNEQGKLPTTEVNPATGNYIYYGSSDWQKELYSDHFPSFEHNLGISGGSDKANYYISGRYYYNKGLFNYTPDTYKQYNLRAKGSMEVFSWLSVENNFSINKSTYNTPIYPDEQTVPLLRRIAGEFSPLAMIYNPDGTFTKNAAMTFASFITGNDFQDQNWNDVRNTFGLNASFLNEKLKIHADITYSNSNYFRNQVYSSIPYSSVEKVVELWDPDSRLNETTNNIEYLGANIYGEYLKTIGRHDFKIMVGYNYENTLRKERYFQRNGLITYELPDPSLTTGQNFISTGGGYEWTTAGEFFRLNYNYANKYLFEMNGRYDGSSKFPQGQQFGFFPSFSGGWRIAQEQFWDALKSTVSDLKIRASYGTLGNGNVDPYRFLEVMPLYLLNQSINGANPLAVNNPNVIPDNLTWEKVTTVNGGVDASFFSNKLSISFDKYIRFTKGMFTPGLPLPGAFGAAVPKGNYADMKTSGWELSVNWSDEIELSKPLAYGFKFTLSDNSSVIEKYNNPNGLLNTYYEGQRLGDIWGYLTDGLFQTSEQLAKAVDQSRVPSNISNKAEIALGDLRFRDLDGDGKITSGAETLSDHGDMKIIGNGQPRYLFGLTANASWNKIGFSIFFQGVGKRDWWPGVDASNFWGQYGRPYAYLPADVYKNQWSPENTGAYFPRLVGYVAQGNGDRALGAPTDRYLQNAAYIRLKNLLVSYDLPEKWISKIGMNNARMYFSGQNLWVWSPMFKITKALDPQGIENKSNAESDKYINSTYNNDQGNTYPILKNFTIGLNVTF